MHWEYSAYNGSNGGTRTPSSGSVNHCLWKYQAQERDSDFDYYLWTSQTTWSQKTTNTIDRHKDGLRTDMRSNTNPSEIWDSQPKIIEGIGCDRSFFIGFNIAFLTIGTNFTQRICKPGSVKRDKNTAKEGAWISDDLTQLREVQTIYVQRVPAGRTPILRASLRIPRYKNTISGTMLYFKTSGGYVYPYLEL
jgi:hypothetical protein